MLSQIAVIAITSIFLVPSAILAAALAAARTEPLKIGLSFAGLLASGMWAFCSYEAFIASDPRWVRVLAWFPALAIGCWTVSLISHIGIVVFGLAKTRK